MVSLNKSYCERMELGAAPYAYRLGALRTPHDAGCKTWVSIEPYPTPNLMDQYITEILDAISFRDRIIIGRTNYRKEISEYIDNEKFYNEQAKAVILFCMKNIISYYIKRKSITN